MCTNGPCKDKIQFTVSILKSCSETQTWEESRNEKHMISKRRQKKADYELREKKKINRM